MHSLYLLRKCVDRWGDSQAKVWGNYFLFVLRFNVQVNNFSLILGWNNHFLVINQYCGELKCLAQGHNRVPPEGIQPKTMIRSPKCSTTRPPHSPQLIFIVQAVPVLTLGSLLNSIDLASKVLKTEKLVPTIPCKCFK